MAGFELIELPTTRKKKRKQDNTKPKPEAKKRKNAPGKPIDKKKNPPPVPQGYSEEEKALYLQCLEYTNEEAWAEIKARDERLAKLKNELMDIGNLCINKDNAEAVTTVSEMMDGEESRKRTEAVFNFCTRVAAEAQNVLRENGFVCDDGEDDGDGA